MAQLFRASLAGHGTRRPGPGLCRRGGGSSSDGQTLGRCAAQSNETDAGAPRQGHRTRRFNGRGARRCPPVPMAAAWPRRQCRLPARAAGCELAAENVSSDWKAIPSTHARKVFFYLIHSCLPSVAFGSGGRFRTPSQRTGYAPESGLTGWESPGIPAFAPFSAASPAVKECHSGTKEDIPRRRPHRCAKSPNCIVVS